MSTVQAQSQILGPADALVPEADVSDTLPQVELAANVEADQPEDEEEEEEEDNTDDSMSDEESELSDGDDFRVCDKRFLFISHIED